MQYLTKRPVESPTHKDMLAEYLEDKRLKEEEEEEKLFLSLDEFYFDPLEDIGRSWWEEDEPWEDIADEWDWDYHDDLYDY